MRHRSVHLRSPSQLLPAGLSGRLFSSRSLPWLLTTAALPGLKPASARRLRGAYPHLLYSIGNPIRQIPIHVAPAQIASAAAPAACRRCNMLAFQTPEL